MMLKRKLQETGEDCETQQSTGNGLNNQNAHNVFVQFCRFEPDTDSTSNLCPVRISTDTNVANLTTILKSLLKSESNDDQADIDDVTYKFFIDDYEITDTVIKTLPIATGDDKREAILQITYQPQAMFKVRAVTRCSSTLPGHSSKILTLRFSPDGHYLATGSADATVRLWDLDAEVPQFVCNQGDAAVLENGGHGSNWILCVQFSPDGRKLASACHGGRICLWDPVTGKQIGKAMRKHTKHVSEIVWKPLHLDMDCRYLASASKDCTVIIWDTLSRTAILTCSHTDSVRCLKWGGTDLLYTGSKDRTIKVWRASDGVLCRTLTQHAHWVNTMSLNTDYALRTGAFNPAHASIVKSDMELKSNAELSATALKLYNIVKGNGPERLVTGSDDFTLALWTPEVDKKCINKRPMTGHQQLVNEVRFSPDGNYIASASFDKSIKIWNGLDGLFIATLRGHVAAVYQLAWAADSRLLVSSSRDSTLKLWNVADVRIKDKRVGARHDGIKVMHDLPGHADEVFALDWSPDGQKVASGGKDAVLKLWRN